VTGYRKAGLSNVVPVNEKLFLQSVIKEITFVAQEPGHEDQEASEAAGAHAGRVGQRGWHQPCPFSEHGECRHRVPSPEAFTADTGETREGAEGEAVGDRVT